ncbi:nucleobase:cation symporter-2 family protein [Paracraurococcus lichenis]|uniref:Nucleobase:cation symporter-2 family protein n=1 Tax=Paracraurococcus lichenis TaxID=3064888 RepID=A0ABT9E2Q2_9PROT|nr:nucleobase:cation symporter-2 family protein [Paracraurococcus sp. LOR1-02]MDO9710429.1 nucleobase:cation symporter-2 family protein [Paracraurococcus sp. LOR1-02]
MPDQDQTVDTVPPAPKLLALALQHVLVMYAGAVAVPLIIGRAAKLPPEQVALLVNADLFACGIATLVQSVGLGPFGIRLPVMMGVTFAAVGPMVAMANAPDLGLLGIFGSVIAAGIVTMLVAPFVSRLLPLFPSVVTGTIILMIGISLMRVGVNWAAGAPAPTLPGYGDPLHLGMAGAVLVLILLITKYARGFLANIAVLLGIVAGCAAAWAIGRMGFAKVAAASWFAPVLPFGFGMPVFDPVAILTMSIVMVVVMIESAGMFLAIGEMVDRRVDEAAMTRGLRTDGLGTVIGGIFNTFPYTSFSQNVGLVGVTGVKSRWVTAAGGAVMLAMGLMPKLGALVESVPLFVLGGAGIVMFGMVAATGVRILSGVDYRDNRHNLYIVAISIGFGLIPLVAPQFFRAMPHALAPILESGILLSAMMAVVLNLYFNGLGTAAAAREGAAAAARSQEAVH